MKKAIAILLFFLLVFNLAGYYITYRVMAYQAENYMAAQLNNNNYNEDEVISFTATMHLPYAPDHTAPERIDGSMTINGKIYRLVNKFVRNDTLHVQCIRNLRQENLNKAFNYILQLSLSDRPANQQHDFPLIHNLFKEFIRLADMIVPSALHDYAAAYIYYQSRLVRLELPVPTHPPQAA